MDKATFTREIRNEIEARINGFLVDHSRIRQDINDSESVIDEYNRRQIFEMLQNIDDQLDGAPDSSEVRSCLIQFDVPERKLVFKNLGEPFSAKGVHSIMLPHISPKKSLGKTTIGNKGLGFRSLLNWAPEAIIIRSNGVELAFSEKIVTDIIKGNSKLQQVLQNEIGRAMLPFLTFPEIRERKVTSKWSTEIELSWNGEKSKGIPEGVAKDIEGELRGFKAELMLFLPNLRQVNIEIKAADGSLEKFCYGATPWEALAEGDDKVFRRRISRFNGGDEISYVEWVAYQEAGELSGIKLKDDESNKFRLAIAVPLDSGVRAGLEGVLYNYLPVKSSEQAVAIKLPCLVNATVHLGPARDALIPNDDANKLIFSKILPRAFAAFAEFLKKHSELVGDKWFPYRLLTPSVQADNSCVKLLYDQLIRLAINGEYCPCVDNEYRKPSSCWYYKSGAEEVVDITDFFNAHRILPRYVLSDRDSIVPSDFMETPCAQSVLAELVNQSVPGQKLPEEELAELISVLVQISKKNQADEPYAAILCDATGHFDLQDDVYTPMSDGEGRELSYPEDYMTIGFITPGLWNAIREKCRYEYYKKTYDWKPRDFINNELRRVVNLRYYDLSYVTQNIIRGCNERLQKTSDIGAKQRAVSQMLVAMLKNFRPGERIELDDYRRRLDIPLRVRPNDGQVLLARDFLFDSIKSTYAGSGMPDWVFLSENERRALFGEASEGRDVDAFLKSIGMREDVRLRVQELRRDDEYVYFLERLESDKNQKNGGLPSGSGNPLSQRQQYLPFIYENDLKCIRKLPTEQILHLLAAEHVDGLLSLVNDQPAISWTIANKKSPTVLTVKWSGVAWQMKGILNGVVLEEIPRAVETFKESLDDRTQPLGLAVDALVKLGAKRRFADLSVGELYDKLAQFDIDGSHQRGVQKFYQKIRMALRQHLESQSDDAERKSLEQRCSELAIKKLKRLCARKGNGPVEVVPREQIRYWDNDVLSRTILDGYYKLEIGNRVGAASVKTLFGVETLGDEVVVPDEQSFVRSDGLSDAVMRRLRERRNYLLAARNREIEDEALLKTAARALKDLSVDVVRRCSYSFDGKRYDMEPGSLVQIDKDKRKYIICSDALNFQEALSKPEFCLSVAEMLCILFNLTGSQISREFREIFRSTAAELRVYAKNDVDEGDLIRAQEALGLTEEETAFWRSVIGRDLTEQELSALAEPNTRIGFITNLIHIAPPASIDLRLSLDECSDAQIAALFDWTKASLKCSETLFARVRAFYLAQIKELRESYFGQFACKLQAKLSDCESAEQERYCFVIDEYARGIEWLNQIADSCIAKDSLLDAKGVFDAFADSVGRKFDIPVVQMHGDEDYLTAPRADENCVALIRAAGLLFESLDPRIQSKCFFKTERLIEVVKAEIARIAGREREVLKEPKSEGRAGDASSSVIIDIDQISSLKGRIKASAVAHKNHDQNKGVHKRAVDFVSERKKHESGLQAQEKAWAAMMKDPKRFRRPQDKTSLTGDQGAANDACHYDFTYLTADGVRRYVEVKAFDEGVFYMSQGEYEFSHNKENVDKYDLMLVVGDEVQYIQAPFADESDIGKCVKIIPDVWKGFAVED